MAWFESRIDRFCLPFTFLNGVVELHAADRQLLKYSWVGHTLERAALMDRQAFEDLSEVH